MTETTNQGYSDRQFLHTTGAAVIVPLAQSGVTGLIVLVVALVIALVNRARDPFTVPLVLGVLAFGWMWFTLTKRWMSLTKLEKLTGMDINRDGVVGSPKAEDSQPRTVKVQISQVKDNGHYQADFVDLPEAQLEKLAGALQAGSPLAESALAGKGKPFSVPEYRKFLHLLIKRGLAKYKNEQAPRMGVELTESGRAVVEQYPPLPHEDMQAID
jgi:hypothetical protein